jgi:hypothetical protein
MPVNNPLERIIGEIRRRTVAGAFPRRALGIGAHRGEVAACGIDQAGKAALSLDGRAAQPGQAGGSSLIFIPMATHSRIKVRRNRCTTEGPERKLSSFAAGRTRRLLWSVNLRSGPRDYHIYIAGRSIRP